VRRLVGVKSPRRKRRPEINIVPLVDVLTVLIFFFIMSMQFRDQMVLNITPPPIETAGQNKDASPIRIAVDEAGGYFFNNAPVTGLELAEALAVAASLDRQQGILLLADEETPLRNVTFVMDTARKEGLENIRLQAR